MAGVFDRTKATAARLIARYGQDCLWQPAPVAAGGEPGYPGDAVPADPIPCKIAWFSPKDLGRGSGEFAALMLGVEIPTSGEIGLMAGNVAFEPGDEDTIIKGTGGPVVGIKSIDRLAPNGEPILYYVTIAG